jgi:hypothetical protein
LGPPGGSEREPATATTPGAKGSPLATGKHPGQARQRSQQSARNRRGHPGRQADAHGGGRNGQPDRRENRRAGGARAGDRAPPEASANQTSEQASGGSRPARHEQARRRSRPARRSTEDSKGPHQPTTPTSDHRSGTARTRNRDKARSRHKHPHKKQAKATTGAQPRPAGAPRHPNDHRPGQRTRKKEKPAKRKKRPLTRKKHDGPFQSG